jgi:HD-like signal output (HDOD) protein
MLTERLPTTPPERFREELIGERLPVLPTAMPHLLRELNDDKLSYATIATLLERFPSVAARLISLANSAWSSPVDPIVSLPDACARLGLNVVRSVSIAIAIAGPFNPNRCKHFIARRFWSSALLTAECAGQLAHHTGVPPHHARTAGLLHNLGLLWLAEYLAAATDLALEVAEANPKDDLERLLEQHAGIGYTTAGARLCEALQLPEGLSDPIALHRTPQHPSANPQLVGVVAIARRMSGAVRHDSALTFANDTQTGISAGMQQDTFAYTQRVSSRIQSLAETLFA